MTNPTLPKWTIGFRTVKPITEEFLGDILVTAFDGDLGACWNWTHPNYEHPNGAFVIDTEKDDLWTAVAITYDDPESDAILETVVDQEKLVRAIQKILDDGTICGSWRLLEEAVFQDDAGNIDAEIADWIVQTAVFGKQVYS